MSSDPTQPAAGGVAREKRVEGYFDRHAETWSELYGNVRHVNDLVLGNRKELAIAYLERSLIPGARILDAGCGAGVLALELAKRGYSVCGVDVSSKMVSLCEEAFRRDQIPAQRYEFHHAALAAAGLPDASFDAVAAMGYLQYQEDERAALAEIGRLLKPDGVLVVSGPVLNTLAGGLGLRRALEAAKDRLRHTRVFQLLRAIRRRLTGSALDPSEHDAVISEISTHRYGVRRFRNLLDDTGFDLLDWQGHGFVGFPGHGRIGLRAEIAVHRGFSALARILPISRFGNDLVVLARKRSPVRA